MEKGDLGYSGYLTWTCEWVRTEKSSTKVTRWVWTSLGHSDFTQLQRSIRCKMVVRRLNYAPGLGGTGIITDSLSEFNCVYDED